MPSLMKHSFANVPPPQIPRSKFERPGGHSTTMDAGKLVPIFAEEVLPGDTKEMRASFLVRLQSLITPAMTNLFFDIHYFFVPNRLLWDHWQNFMGEKTGPSDATTYLVPQMSNAEPWNPDSMSVADYLGIPPALSAPNQDDMPIALPFRAYNKIFNAWYRDENLQEMVPELTDDGPDTYDAYALYSRNKKKDYFTSALPWPQKGDSVSISLAQLYAPVIGTGLTIGYQDATTHYGLGADNGSSSMRISQNNYNTAVGTAGNYASVKVGSTTLGLTTEVGKSGMQADLTDLSIISISDLREAFAAQQMLERDARGGTRYTEILKAHFGVDVPDYRLQRPEFLGGHSQRIDIRAVSQTSQTDITPQGNQAAYSVTASKGGFKHSFVEHGWIIGIASIRGIPQYQQGLHRKWSRRTREDYYDPIYAHLGEQAILRKEIYANNNLAQNNTVFGYQERWAEYRYSENLISGIFRHTVSAPYTTLDSWHTAQFFSSAPTLNETFIAENPAVDRIIAVTGEPQFFVDMYWEIDDYRPIPIFSVPGLDRL